MPKIQQQIKHYDASVGRIITLTGSHVPGQANTRFTLYITRHSSGDLIDFAGTLISGIVQSITIFTFA